MAIALDMQKGITHEDSNVIEFPIIEVASAIGWDSGVVKSHLKNLEWTTAGEEHIHEISLHGSPRFVWTVSFIWSNCLTANGLMKRSSISVHYDKLGLRVKAPGDLSDVELDEALDALIARTQSQETSCLRQLEVIFTALNRISVSSTQHCSVFNDNVAKRSEELKDTVRKYFQSSTPLDNVDISFQVCFFDRKILNILRSYNS